MDKVTQLQITLPEEKYESDFKPLAGFWNYHVKNKIVPIALKDVQGFGVKLKPTRINVIGDTDIKEIPLNTMLFSSTKKKHNVKNLMWVIRCLAHHPENIQEINVNGTNCYAMCCTTKERDTDELIYNMKAIIASEVWPQFTKQLTGIIKEVQQ